jgi:hypothetical protein
MSTKETALSIMNSFNLAPLSDSDDVAIAIREEMKGESLELPKVKIPSGDGIMFSIKHPGVDRPEMTEYIDGVVIHHHKMNSFWAGSYGSGDAMPDCVSLNGEYGVESESGECHNCANCPRNQFGSDPAGTGGKACKNGERLYILRDGEYLPLQFILPPTALKAWRTFKQLLIVPRGTKPSLRTYNAVIRISLTTESNSKGTLFARPNFELLGAIPSDKVEGILGYAEAFKAAATKVSSSDYTVVENENVFDS